MSKTRLLSSCEVSINFAIKRLSKLKGKNKKALKSEFKEWIEAVEGEKKDYEVLYITSINQ
tara:strand:+ start:1179 stop:1361 length:183 start_codon:yes stop_codon:yes gene_type:complete